MMTTQEMVRRSSRLFDDAADALLHRGGGHAPTRRQSYSIGGAVALGLLFFFFYSIFPELRRYIRISRM